MIERIAKILKKPVCANCLGRQFGQLLSGYTNEERGRILRSMAALAVDAGKIKDIDLNNFYGFKFRQSKELEKIERKEKECWICNGFFKNLDKFVEEVAKQAEKYEFDKFLVGTKLSRELLEKEEELWMDTGIDFCEPLKNEINREVGKKLEKRLGIKADLKNPDAVVFLDLEKGKAEFKVNPLFVFGYYQKLVRGIPQCRWGTPGLYKNSVEEEVGRIMLKETKGKDHRFHGAGREDINARCLGWRPFVIEIIEPVKRKLDLRKIEKLVSKGKKVNIKGLKISNMDVVRNIKNLRSDKTYMALVTLDKKIEKKDLEKLKKLKGEILQKTPERVLHRRADLLRKRHVKELKFKFLNGKKFELIIKGTAGLYIKELISGDNGRTKPSVSELLERKAVCKELDVIKFQKISHNL